MRTRRRFLHEALALAAGAGLPFSRSRAAGGAVKSRPDVVIHDGTYPGWPWVTTGPDGVLHCVFREGTVHDYSPSGRVLLCQSADSGKSWTKAQVVVDAADVDDRNAAVVVLSGKSGKDLLVTYNTYTKARESLAMTVRSSDGGRTWEKPRPVGEPNTRTKAAAYVLADGGLLLPYYLAPGSGAVAGLSRDGGVTWKTVRVPDAEGFVGDEWDVLEVEPGRLVGILRNSHPRTDGTFWKTESRDGGRTWTVPRPTNVRSLRHPSPAQFVRQGRSPTLIYADRRMVSVAAVKTTDPEFLRWDLDGRLPCYRYNADESPIPDGSYPVSAPLDGRRRLVVDYEIRPDSKRITGYFVSFPEGW